MAEAGLEERVASWKGAWKASRGGSTTWSAGSMPWIGGSRLWIGDSSVERRIGALDQKVDRVREELSAGIASLGARLGERMDSFLAGRMEEVLSAIEEPDWVTAAYGGALAAWRGLGRRRYLGVLYREVSDEDGFVITAFLTRKPRRKPKLWP